FIGHPLVGNVAPTQTREAFFAAHGLDPAKKLVTILPGSRNSELARHLPILRAACARIHAEMPVQFVVAAAPSHTDLLRLGWPSLLNVHVIDGHTYDALAHADPSIVSSGSATVDA